MNADGKKGETEQILWQCSKCTLRAISWALKLWARPVPRCKPCLRRVRNGDLSVLWLDKVCHIKTQNFSNGLGLLCFQLFQKMKKMRKKEGPAFWRALLSDVSRPGQTVERSGFQPGRTCNFSSKVFAPPEKRSRAHFFNNLFPLFIREWKVGYRLDAQWHKLNYLHFISWHFFGA